MPSSVAPGGGGGKGGKTGARPVADYLRLIINGTEALEARLDVPVIVWSLPREREEELLLSTKAGGPRTRPEPGETIAYELRKGTSSHNVFAMGVTVGRTENNDVVIEDNSVSRFHAFFQQDKKAGWKLVDAESSNGTWVGPLKLAPNKGQPLKNGDKLRFGEIEVQFFEPKGFIAWLKKI